MGVVVRLDGFSFLIVLVVWVIVPVIFGLVLYWIIRLGVKHGIRSYHSDSDGRRPSAE